MHMEHIHVSLCYGEGKQPVMVRDDVSLCHIEETSLTMTRADVTKYDTRNCVTLFLDTRYTFTYLPA